MCVQRFDDSLNSAIHITYRISLRSSSMREPRDPLLKVLSTLILMAPWPSQTSLPLDKARLEWALPQAPPACRAGKRLLTWGSNMERYAVGFLITRSGVPSRDRLPEIV
jgi:hypothetical protein